MVGNYYFLSKVIVYPKTKYHTICFAGDRAMLHDPHSYSEPIEFRPERFLVLEDKQPEQDPRTICFGFGRRSVGCDLMPATHPYSFTFSICPGRFVFSGLRVLNTMLDGRFTTC